MEQGKLVDLFILGLLSRHGPQHGYGLQQLIAVQAADFSSIKLPTVYYHLPPARRLFASLIFEHHALHFKAERDWVLRCIEQLSGGTSPDRQVAEKE